MTRHRAASTALMLILFGAASVSPARADATVAESIAIVDKELAESPNDPALWQRRAALERLRGNRDRAEVDLARAAELGLAPTLVQRDQGLILAEAGRTAEAEAVLRGARALAPADVTILLPHARALTSLGRWREAADTYAEVVRLAPDANPDVHLERVRTLGLGGSSTTDEALAALDAAIVRLGAVPALDQEALAIELRAGRTDAALKRLDRMSGATKRPEPFLVQRGQILEQAGRDEEAAAAYGAALAAMQSLNPQRRATPAAAELEQHAQAGVARIAARAQGEGR